MRVIFRADASVMIGTGHVMRCLTLADALVLRGCNCVFLTRPLSGNMCAAIEARGHQVILLTEGDETPEDPDDLYGCWLGVSRLADAAECHVHLTQLAPDRIVVDHYALDATWENAAVPDATPVMAIDDLADRRHACDILLDQNYGRTDADYDGLLSKAALRMTGTQFALLRPEFAQARADSLARRDNAVPSVLMISMGGSDKDNATGQVLDLLAKSQYLASWHIVVVMGGTAPHLDAVRAQVAAMPHSVDLQIDVTDMAALMRDADLAVGGAGGTAWERCCLGLPTLVLSVADNQLAGACALSKSGATIYLGDIRDGSWQARLLAVLGDTCSSVNLAEMSHIARDLCDGDGTKRVADAIVMRVKQDIHDGLRPANHSDIEPVWNWRYSGNAQAFYRSADVPSLLDHMAWMIGALADPLRDLRIFHQDDQALAHIRFDIDPQNPSHAEISIYLAQEARGQGIGQKALACAVETPPVGVTRLYAEVHLANAASAKIFEKLGFQILGTTGSFRKLALNIMPIRALME